MRIRGIILSFILPVILWSQQTTNRTGSFDSLKSNRDTIRVIDTVRFYYGVRFDAGVTLRSTLSVLGTSTFSDSASFSKIKLSADANREIGLNNRSGTGAGYNLTVMAGLSSQGTSSTVGGNLILRGGGGDVDGTGGNAYLYGGSSGVPTYGNTYVGHDGSSARGNTILGTVTTGTWQGTDIDIAYLDTSQLSNKYYRRSDTVSILASKQWTDNKFVPKADTVKIVPGTFTSVSYSGHTATINVDTTKTFNKLANNVVTGNNIFTKKQTFTGATKHDTILYTNSLKDAILFVNSNQTITSGTATSFQFGVLNDSTADFDEGMVGKLVYRVTLANNTDDAPNTTRAPETWARITKFISDTSIELSYSIFDSASSPYYVIDNHTGVASLTTGITTSVASNKLIDSRASFTAGMVGKMVILIDVADGDLKPNRAIVQTVDSPTQLTLDENIFTAVGKLYAIKNDTTNDFRYIQSAVEGFHSKKGAHFVFLSNGKYRENVLISQNSIGKDDSYDIAKYWMPRIHIIGNPEDNTTVKMIGCTPAQDSSYISYSSSANGKILFLSNGGITSYVSGIWAYQFYSFFTCQVGASVKIENCSLSNRKITGEGIFTEQWSLAEAKNNSYRNLFAIANGGRQGGLIQIQGTSNTADSCTYLFDGGKSLVYFHAGSTLTVTGNPILQYTPSMHKGLTIVTNSAISGTYSMPSTFITGGIVDDTLYAKTIQTQGNVRLHSGNLTVSAGSVTASGLGSFAAGAFSDTVRVTSDITIGAGNAAGIIIDGTDWTPRSGTPSIGENSGNNVYSSRSSHTFVLDNDNNQTTGLFQIVNNSTTGISGSQIFVASENTSQTILTKATNNTLIIQSWQRFGSSADVANLDTNGQVQRFASTPMSGDGLVSTPDTIVWTAQTASIGSQNFANTATGHFYEVSYYVHTTTIGTGTVTFNLAWNDGTAKTFSSATAALTATDNTGYVDNDKRIYVASGTPSWSTTVAGGGSTEQYAVRVILKRLY